MRVPDVNPAHAVHVAPRLVEYDGLPSRGAHTKIMPSADTAIAPWLGRAGGIAVDVDSGEVANGVHVFPPSTEYAPRAPLADEFVPTRATTFGSRSAKSRLLVLPKIGFANIPSGGEASRSSWRNPAMSPTPLSSGGPDGGLTRSSGTVSSRPSLSKRHVVAAPVSETVTSSVDHRPWPVM